MLIWKQTPYSVAKISHAHVPMSTRDGFTISRRITRRGPRSDVGGPTTTKVDLRSPSLRHRLAWLQFLSTLPFNEASQRLRTAGAHWWPFYPQTFESLESPVSETNLDQ